MKKMIFSLIKIFKIKFETHFPEIIDLKMFFDYSTIDEGRDKPQTIKENLIFLLTSENLF